MRLFVIFCFLCTFLLCLDPVAATRRRRQRDFLPSDPQTGHEMFQRAVHLLHQREYQKSKNLFRQAIRSDDIIQHSDINDVIEQMLTVHKDAGVVWAGYTLVAEVMKAAGNKDDARQLVQMALTANPSYADAAILKAELVDHDVDLYALIMRMMPDLQTAIQNGMNDPEILSRAAALYSNCLVWDTAEVLYSRSFELDPSEENLKSFSSSVFMRNHICKWGRNGSLYEKDMTMVADIIRREVKTTFRKGGINQASVFTPANVLSYPISPVLKLAVAQAFSRAELSMVVENTKINPLNHSAPDMIRQTRRASKTKDFRIRIGYVSANIKSRTTTFMAQNVLMSHDKSKFEVHIYATTPRDSDDLLYNRMRGVDWRSKIQKSVEYFHETHMMDTGQLFKLIRKHDIHILLNWDGYSNAGIRAAGIFALTPAPIQINHQEYIGTMGADYIQYFISDEISSPPEYRKYFSEKLILMPHAFLATSMAYLGPEMTPPARETPSPELNGCHGLPASFVYCNMNKHMKFSPELFRHWMYILQSVPGSILCLLQNPPQAEPFLREFISEIDESLQSRVRYSEFIVNPYDNQQRVKDNCNVVLDTPIYSGHTTNADALWAGVPIVTHGTSIDVSGRVGQSMLTAVGLPELIATSQEHYDDIAIEFGLNRTFYVEKRDKLVKTCLAKKPAHPYWDLKRYTEALESGFEAIFQRYIDGKPPAHVQVKELFKRNKRSGRKYPSGYDTVYIEDIVKRPNDLSTIEKLLAEDTITLSAHDNEGTAHDDEIRKPRKRRYVESAERRSNKKKSVANGRSDGGQKRHPKTNLAVSKREKSKHSGGRRKRRQVMDEL